MIVKWNVLLKAINYLIKEEFISFYLELQAKLMWSQMTAEQKATYGEDYYEAAMSSAERYSNQVNMHLLNLQY